MTYSSISQILTKYNILDTMLTADCDHFYFYEEKWLKKLYNTNKDAFNDVVSFLSLYKNGKTPIPEYEKYCCLSGVYAVDKLIEMEKVKPGSGVILAA